MRALPIGAVRTIIVGIAATCCGLMQLQPAMRPQPWRNSRTCQRGVRRCHERREPGLPVLRHAVAGRGGRQRAGAQPRAAGRAAGRAARARRAAARALPLARGRRGRAVRVRRPRRAGRRAARPPGSAAACSAMRLAALRIYAACVIAGTPHCNVPRWQPLWVFRGNARCAGAARMRAVAGPRRVRRPPLLVRRRRAAARRACRPTRWPRTSGAWAWASCC